MITCEKTFSQAISKKVVKDFNCIFPDERDYYAHPTFIISNLADYVRLIASISEVNHGLQSGDTIIYRGMADSGYNLLPGLARISNSVPDMEGMLVHEFLARRPDAFRGLSEFDVLAKMQHYGLPTRLLDFSLNPLVALYFACESKASKQGRVLCHSSFLQNDSSPFVRAVCSASIQKPFDECYTVDEYYCTEYLPLRKYLSEAYIYEETTVVQPKYWNQRITNQAGVFMVFTNNLYDRYRLILIHERELGLDGAMREYSRGKTDIETIKEALRREPIDLYRNENNPFLTDICFKRMIDAYNGEKSDFLWKTIKNRFRLSDKVKPLSKEKISDQFCSIIIDPRSKKKILRDLASVGFRVDYIYPELEYTAKEIRRRFE